MSKGFKPMKYLAKCCNTIIFSTRPGEFVSCKCGECYVDQTPYYTRVGGEQAEPLEGEVERLVQEDLFGEDRED